MLDRVHGLWIGDLGELEILSMKSFLKNGHEYHLWRYDPAGDVPDGVVICDANEVVPVEVWKRWCARELLYGVCDHLRQSFANYFRYKLIHQEGGVWSDMDVVCLKPIPSETSHLFISVPDIPLRSENLDLICHLGPYGNVANGFFKAPSGCPMLSDIMSQIEPDAISARFPEKFGTWGSVMLSRLVVKHNLLRYRLDRFMDYGFAYSERQYKEPLPIPDCYILHFWNYRETFRPTAGSLFTKVKEKYL